MVSFRSVLLTLHFQPARSAWPTAVRRTPHALHILPLGAPTILTLQLGFTKIRRRNHKYCCVLCLQRR